MMKSLSLYFLLSLVVGIFSDTTVFLPAVEFGGFNVIFSNDTSYLDEIDSHGDVMYVSGEGIVREVVENPFSLEYNPRFFAQSHRFIDFKAFNDGNGKTWVFGPISAHHVPNTVGFSHPFQLSSTENSYTQQFTQAGILYSSVLVHSTSVQSYLAYVAGWALQGSTINLVVARLTITPASASDNNIFTSESPVSLNSTSGYDDFYRTFKPKIFRNGEKSYIIVVDPSSRCIYKIAASGDDTSAPATLSFIGSVHVIGRFGGVTYDPQKEIVYVALVALGTNPGSIVSISTSDSNPSIVSTISLTQYQSNPTALHIKDGSLYIGFNGGHAIIQINLSDASVPHNVAAIHARHSGDVYFVTYDQFAKVAKIDQQHFCSRICDAHYGYCANSECKCINGTTLNKDGTKCDTTTQNSQNYSNHSHAGEVALGLLFAVTFITAVIGWFLLWRTRKHGGLNKSGYSATSNYERESFLGGDVDDDDDA